MKSSVLLMAVPTGVYPSPGLPTGTESSSAGLPVLTSILPALFGVLTVCSGVVIPATDTEIAPAGIAETTIRTVRTRHSQTASLFFLFIFASLKNFSNGIQNIGTGRKPRDTTWLFAPLPGAPTAPPVPGTGGTV